MKNWWNKKSVFYEDPLKKQDACNEICDYVNKLFCSDYEHSQSIEVLHEECEACATIGKIFEEPKMKKS